MVDVGEVTGRDVRAERFWNDDLILGPSGATMRWSFDRTGEVILWGAASGCLALLLHALGFSSCSWIFIGCWLLSAGIVLKLSCIKVSSVC